MFSQFLDFLDRNDFNYLARKYGGDKYVKQVTCYNQLCVLMFGQLSNRESQRDIVLATQAHASKAYHLGFGKYAAKSTLAELYHNRWQIELFFKWIKQQLKIKKFWGTTENAVLFKFILQLSPIA